MSKEASSPMTVVTKAIRTKMTVLIFGNEEVGGSGGVIRTARVGQKYSAREYWRSRRPPEVAR